MLKKILFVLKIAFFLLLAGTLASVSQFGPFKETGLFVIVGIPTLLILLIVMFILEKINTRTNI